MHKFLSKYFGEDEKIIISFSPDTKRNFCYKDIVLLPAGVLSLITALCLVFDDILRGIEYSFSFSLWKLIFLLISLYILFGRFYAKKNRKKNTVYIITNKRFYRITKNIFKKARLDFVDILDIDELEIDGIPPESATIVFKKIPVSFTKFFANTGLAFESKFFAFVDVRRASQICDKIAELKQQAEIAELIETREKLAEIKKAQESAARREIETLENDSENNNPEN